MPAIVWARRPIRGDLPAAYRKETDNETTIKYWISDGADDGGVRGADLEYLDDCGFGHRHRHNDNDGIDWHDHGLHAGIVHRFEHRVR